MAFRRGSDVLVPYYRDLGLVLGVGMYAVRDPLLDCSRGGRTVRSGGSSPTTTRTTISACSRSRSIIAGALHARRRRGRGVQVPRRDRPSRDLLDRRRRDERRRVARVGQLTRRSTRCRSSSWSKTTSGRSRPRKACRCASPTSPTRRRVTGCRAVVCDGFDPIATYARDEGGDGPRAHRRRPLDRRGESAIAISRTRPTTTIARTATREEIEEHRKLDPVPRFEQILIEHGVIDEARAKSLQPGRAARDQRSDRRCRGATVSDDGQPLHQRGRRRPSPVARIRWGDQRMTATAQQPTGTTVMTNVEAVRATLHDALVRDDRVLDHGRGRRRARQRLLDHQGLSRRVRSAAHHRHAARGSLDRRRRDRDGDGRLAAGRRDPVRRLHLSGVQPDRRRSGQDALSHATATTRVRS